MSLAEIRARLAATDNNQNTRNNRNFDNSVYPHWNMAEGKSATVRFLEDSNSSNPLFWVERAMIRLPFKGIKGQSDTNQVLVRVPCMEMWNDTCPILTEVRPWFKDPSLEQMGRDYWKKREYFFQGFVRENPVAEDDLPENPIRRFIIGPQIYAIIKASLLDPELEQLPTHHVQGLDFRINKTSKGGNADYTTSTWARRESALTEAEEAAIEKYGIPDLSSYLPKKPGREELNIIKEMFEASVDGKPYDSEKWGQYYRPAGMSAPSSSSDTSSKPSVAVSKPAIDDEDDTPWKTPVSYETKDNLIEKAAKEQDSGNKAEDILAMIRSRKTVN